MRDEPIIVDVAKGLLKADGRGSWLPASMADVLSDSSCSWFVICGSARLILWIASWDATVCLSFFCSPELPFAVEVVFLLARFGVSGTSSSSTAE